MTDSKFASFSAGKNHLSKNTVFATVSVLFVLSVFAGCTKQENTVELQNKDKPVIFFNRQPSDPISGTVDMNTMNFSPNVYYVGTDSTEGGSVQGELIKNFLKLSDPSKIDRNGDGVIGYVLCIGDIGHNDSKARTKGVRKALGTWNGSTSPADTRAGSITISGKEYFIVELESKEMTAANGSTWSDETAKESMSEWVDRYGSQIDLVISNNDGMAMGCLRAPNYPANVPIFGYDANADAIEAIQEGRLTGTVSQNADAQASATLQLIRNLLDGQTDSNIYTKGFSEPDSNGNQISANFEYSESKKSLLAKNTGVNKSNCSYYANGMHDKNIKQLPSSVPVKKVLLTIFNSENYFLTASYVPALQYYAPLLNIELTIVEGNGQNEDSCLSQFTNLGNYDAYAINMIMTDSGNAYLTKLSR